jgi:hypothetical protein
MVFMSSHGYRLLIVSVRDDAEVRTDGRHVEIVGHLHANPEAATRNERYPAASVIYIEESEEAESVGEALGILSAPINPSGPVATESDDRVIHLPSGREGVLLGGGDLVLVKWDVGCESRVDHEELRRLNGKPFGGRV